MAESVDLLERMRRSKNGWKERDLERPFVGFGFEREEGKKHILYTHPRYPDLMATVTRSSGGLPVGYISKAVRLIDEVQERNRQHDNGDQ